MINEFLKKYFPKLNDFFIRNDFSISNFVHKWLVTIFSENFMKTSNRTPIKLSSLVPEFTFFKI